MPILVKSRSVAGILGLLLLDVKVHTTRTQIPKQQAFHRGRILSLFFHLLHMLPDAIAANDGQGDQHRPVKATGTAPAAPFVSQGLLGQ